MNMTNYINRPNYLTELVSFKDDKTIKVVTGMRRCGKSTLLFDIYGDYLLSQGIDLKQIIKVNLESLENESLHEYHALYNYITKQLVSGKMNYVMIDEVQNCLEFERVVDSLYIKENVDIYITGSNAFMFSSQLATLLSGRYITIKMLPLSFKEFATTTQGPQENIRDVYSRFVKFGSMPKIIEYKNDTKMIDTYLDSLYTTVFKKDIIDRNKISNVPMFESVLKFVLANIGSPISAKSISDYLASTGKKIASQYVDEFLSYLVSSYMVYKAERYDVKSKETLRSLGKYYVTDIGLRNFLLGYRNIDTGHVLENIVYLELLRRGYKVFVGKVDDKEVDFVAQKQEEIIYFQVAETVKGEGTLARELAPFKIIKDYYTRILLTLDNDPNVSYDGIKHINALEWCLKD
jgi:predicted AAA+ superfamily ATPase